MKPSGIILFPFSMLYGAGIKLRNWLYDKNLKQSRQFDVPVIGIGNLSAGGTGKTPMTEYILGLLQAEGYRPAMLSRGYGRRSKGFYFVDNAADAARYGDEPCQVKHNFPELTVAVCEDRVSGIERILQERPETDVVVLDDCYQHRRLKPGFMVLLTDYNRPYFEDTLLPGGRLREGKAGRARADVIVMTKSPQGLASADKVRLKRELKPLPGQEVYFTGLAYHQLKKAESKAEETGYPLQHMDRNKILLFTGIANPQPLYNYLKDKGITYTAKAFGDHHRFRVAEMQELLKMWLKINTPNKLMLTTEKDWRRLEGTPEAQLLDGIPLFFLPVELKWDRDEKLSFDSKILTYVSANKRSS